MENHLPGYIDFELKYDFICSNKNRAVIFYALGCYKNGIQPEKLANLLGLSHRTVLYHLDILNYYGLAEVKKYRERGYKLIRALWGLNTKNKEIQKLLRKLKCAFKFKERV